MREKEREREGVRRTRGRGVLGSPESTTYSMAWHGKMYDRVRMNDEVVEIMKILPRTI